MAKPLGLFVLYREGERAREALAQVRPLVGRMVVIHDGPFDSETRNVAAEFADDLLEYDKAGCKEPHLARFFAESLEGASWVLHVDSDEVLSDQLAAELAAADMSNPCLYAADLVHVRENGQVARYRKGSKARATKPVLFHIDTLVQVIGIPHKGPVFNMAGVLLDGALWHKARHLDFSLGQLLVKEWRFAVTDAIHRSRPIQVFRHGQLIEIPPDDFSLKWIDRARYRSPLIYLVPCLAYRLAQSLMWMTDIRSGPALVEELKLTIAREIYQARLCWLIRREKSAAGR